MSGYTVLCHCFFRGVVILCSLLSLLSSCRRSQTSEKVVDVPSAVVAERVEEAVESEAFTSSEQLPEDWWQVFNDPQLADLICQGLAFHPSLQRAEAVIRQAADQARYMGASLWPKIDFNADSTRYQVSKTGLFGVIAPQGEMAPVNPLCPPPPRRQFPFNYTQTEFYFNFNYEIDWWGKNRDAICAAIGEVQARIAERAIARLTLSTYIAENYIHLQAAIARESLAKTLVSNREEIMRLTQQRISSGLDSSIRYYQYEQQLFQAKELLEHMQQLRRFYEDILRSLIADTFQETFEPSTLLDNIQPLPLPANLPLDLIARRPDLTAQIWRIEAAFKQVQVACKEFYPNLNLIALWGHQTLSIEKLFSSKSAYSNYGPAINLPIFRGGELKANLAQREEQHLLAILDYEEMILNIIKDVLTGISAVEAWHERTKALADVERSVSAEYALTADRVKFKVGTRLDLLDVERTRLGSLDALAQAKESYLIAQLALIKALGGGYLAPGSPKE